MLPRLTQARAPLTRDVDVIDEHGRSQLVSIPAERDLTVYVDKRELVTLMTLGAHPEWLVLGYLRNQRLVRSADEVESVTVDYWEQRMAINQRPAFFAVQAVVPGMKRLGGGSIVNLGSTGWQGKDPAYPCYAIAKSSVNGLTRGLAAGLVAQGQGEGGDRAALPAEGAIAHGAAQAEGVAVSTARACSSPPTRPFSAA